MKKVACLLATLGLAAAAKTVGGDDKNRPVSKVISLLQDMSKQLDKEQQEDEEIYDKLACWCETNDREKTKSISDAQAHLADLGSSIEELTAKSSRLSSEIKSLKKEVAKNQNALDQATSLRQKELADFNAEEKDMLGSISALKAAVTVLSKHHAGALIQEPPRHLRTASLTLRYQLEKHPEVLRGVLSPAERRTVEAFLQAPSYSSQSGEIFGILNQMLETFESNLSESQKQELASQKAYEELKSAKQQEIAAGQSQIDTKSQELAESDQKLAFSKQDVEDTRKTLAADQEFLANLKDKCAVTDKEWEERTKARNVEKEAIAQALAILSSDNTHDLFTRTFNPSFSQKESRAVSQRRSQAAQLLSAAAERLAQPALSALATKVRLDAFERVKKAIDDMVQQLLHEKADEIKHKDFCVVEFNANSKQTEDKEREKQGVETLIATLENTIAELTKAIDNLKAEVKELQVQMKRAGEDRELQNKEFQSTIADQRESQQVLQNALSVLEQVYAKGSSFLATKQEPPAGFSTYGKNPSGGGVVALLKQIIADAKAMEAEAIRSEEDAQKSYEDFVKDTNASIEAKNKDAINKTQIKAGKEGDLVAAKESHDNVVLELEMLSNYNAQLHSSCDFVLKNFEVRQTARDEEVEALRQAKAILSGAKFD